MNNMSSLCYRKRPACGLLAKFHNYGYNQPAVISSASLRELPEPILVHRMQEGFLNDWVSGSISYHGIDPAFWAKSRSAICIVFINPIQYVLRFEDVEAVKAAAYCTVIDLRPM
jgi:hypothetical protein